MEWVKRLIVNSSSIKAQNTWEVEIVLDICFFLNCVIISVILKYLKCLRHLLSKSALQMGQYLGASKELKSLHMPQPLNRYILKCLLFCSMWEINSLRMQNYEFLSLYQQPIITCPWRIILIQLPIIIWSHLITF